MLGSFVSTNSFFHLLSTTDDDKRRSDEGALPSYLMLCAGSSIYKAELTNSYRVFMKYWSIYYFTKVMSPEAVINCNSPLITTSNS